MELTVKKIFSLYKKYAIPEHIIKHMAKVAEYALSLCEKFEKKGIKIDKNTVVKAALIHDVLRPCDFREFPSNAPEEWVKLRKKYHKKGHEKATSEILNKMGFKKIANLVLKHDFYKIDELKTWEEKILYYSDKRVEKDGIVELKERFKKGRERNFKPTDDLKKIKETEKKIVALEKEINSMLRRRN